MKMDNAQSIDLSKLIADHKKQLAIKDEYVERLKTRIEDQNTQLNTLTQVPKQLTNSECKSNIVFNYNELTENSIDFHDMQEIKRSHYPEQESIEVIRESIEKLDKDENNVQKLKEQRTMLVNALNGMEIDYRKIMHK